MNKNEMLKDLNPQQEKALLHTEGPLLILAGAGSGKTRVITYKFAYLTNALNIPPYSILAMTFTNKAAEEMKGRIEHLLCKSFKGLWIGTFHALSNRILRKEIERLEMGLTRDFVIYDEADSCRLIRSILNEFRIHEALYRGIASKISSLKASLIGPGEFIAQGDGFGFDEKLARVYVKYQDKLKRNNALDFDDLIMHAVRLFETCPDVLGKYHKEFFHILVDEFQDTNAAQYRLLKLLAEGRKNLCVVGDDDQSIYRFRGADVRNILSFEKDFPDAKIVKLEQNYRSTQNVLSAADGVIAKNPSRKPKKLWTERGNGEKVYYCVTDNETEEARYIAKAIREFYLKGKHPFSDFAILYRVNLQSRILEETFRSDGIPYHIIGGVSFYQRKEIKDAIAYLKVIANPQDSVSLRRIINCPPRGIGDVTLSKLEQEAKKKDIGLFEAMKLIVKGNGSASSPKEKIIDFIKNIEDLISHQNTNVRELLNLIFEKTGYLKWVEEERAENLMELLNAAEGKDLYSFLDTAALFSGMDEEQRANSVTLMTLHSAKGLEFPVVFIAGLEEGLLPHFHAIKNPEELQEERRLFYVGMTRAKDILILTGAKTRKLYAAIQEQEPSRFIMDIPAEYCRCFERKPRTVSLSEAVRSPEVLTKFSPFAVGARVKHPKWGVGVIRDFYGETNDPKVTVNFLSVGVKRLSLKLAHLERL